MSFPMALSLDEILTQLECASGALPEVALRAAALHGPEVVAPLIAAIERATREPAQLPEEYTLHLFALFVLAQRRERGAYGAIVQMCKLSEHDLDELIGDVVTESLPQILASVALGNISLLQELLEDESVCEWVRSSALLAIAASAVEGAISQEQLIGYLEQLWRGDRIARRPCIVWGEMACVAADLGLAEFLADIELTFDQELIIDNIIGWDEAVEDLSGDPPRFRPEPPLRYRFVSDAVAELAPFWGAEQDASEWQKARAVQPDRGAAKVGRNEPCPCGSGRKFKKCCGQP
tara:strand:- start:1759 stop:2637 length:879 start_codon:yes stop_codon:yes gene_type:complete